MEAAGSFEFRVFRRLLGVALQRTRHRKNGKVFCAEKSCLMHGLKSPTDQIVLPGTAVVGPGPWVLALHCPAGHLQHACPSCHALSVAKPWLILVFLACNLYLINLCVVSFSCVCSIQALDWLIALICDVFYLCLVVCDRRTGTFLLSRVTTQLAHLCVLGAGSRWVKSRTNAHTHGARK